MISDNACNLETFDDCDIEPDSNDAPTPDALTPDTPTSQAQSEAQVSRTRRSK